ncbi:hypothetical protein GCM10027271_38270 [Saccharopolyspora gloriosae]
MLSSRDPAASWDPGRNVPNGDRIIMVLPCADRSVRAFPTVTPVRGRTTGPFVPNRPWPPAHRVMARVRSASGQVTPRTTPTTRGHRNNPT